MEEEQARDNLQKTTTVTLHKHIIVPEWDCAYLSRVWVARSSHVAWLQKCSSERLPCTAGE